jgi:hypothetical protein
MELPPEYPPEIRAAHIAARQRPIEQIDFTARRARMEYLRGWQRLAASGHAGAQAVLSHRDVQDELRAHHERVSHFAHMFNQSG